MSDAIKQVVRDMVDIVTAGDATEDELAAALDTIDEAFEPTGVIDLLTMEVVSHAAN